MNSVRMEQSRTGNQVDIVKPPSKKITAVLSSILRTATEWEVIASNPCDKVRSKGDDMMLKRYHPSWGIGKPPPP